MAERYKTPDGWRYQQERWHQQRARWWDYCNPCIYMLTIVTIDRKPLLGRLVGEHIERTAIGDIVAAEIERMPTYKDFACAEVYSYVIMPDHVHILLQVHERLSMALGQYVSWFKRQCNIAAQEAAGTTPPGRTTGWNAISSTTIDRRVEKGVDNGPALAGSTASIFAPEYHDRILTHKGQLGNMKRYILDNPRRLALKRANPDLFKIRQQMNICGVACTAMGNMFLAEYPQRQVLQCSRSLRQAEIDAKREECLLEAEKGTIFISAAISEGEKQICRTLREAGFPLIVLLSGGFPTPDEPHYQYYKPNGVYFEACAAGRLLLIEPDKSLSEQPETVEQVVAKAGKIPHDCLRYKFLALNAIAGQISKYQPQ